MKKCSENFSLCRCPCCSCIFRVELQQARRAKKKSFRCGLRTSLSSPSSSLCSALNLWAGKLKNIIAFRSGSASRPAHGCIGNFPRRRLPCSCSSAFFGTRNEFHENGNVGLERLRRQKSGNWSSRDGIPRERSGHELSQIRWWFNVDSQSRIASSVSFFYDHNNIRRK